MQNPSALDILRACACGSSSCPCAKSLERGGGMTHCPAHDDERPSFDVAVRDGKTLFVCRSRRCPQERIIEELRRRGVWGSNGKAERATPARGARRMTRFEVRDVDGRLRAIHERTDLADGSKRFRLLHPDGTPSKNGEIHPADLPLYGSESLRDAPADAAPILVEGEKKRDALAALGFLVLGTVTGASVTPSIEVLRILARFKRVYLWADNDDAGRAHMERIAALLRSLGVDVRFLTWREAPSKGDAADFIEAGGTAEGVRAHLDAATSSMAPEGTESAARETQRRPIIIRACDLQAPEVSYLVDALIGLGMLTLLSGRDKRGKTLLAQEIVRCVLMGTAFLGQFPVKQGTVIAAFLDDPVSVTRNRLDALGVLNHPSLYIAEPSSLDGDPMRFLDAFAEEAKDYAPTLIVIDALYLFTPGSADAGNDAARMGPIMERLDKITVTTGASVLLICHDNKSGQDVAGSHVIRARAKCILRLRLPRGEETKEKDAEPATPRRRLTTETKLGPPLDVLMELHGIGDWRYLGEPRIVKASDLRARLLELAQDRIFRTAEEWREAVKAKAEDVRGVLLALCREGMMREDRERKDGRHGGRPRVLYGLADGGKETSRGKETSDAQPASPKSDEATAGFPTDSRSPGEEEWDGNSKSEDQRAAEEGVTGFPTPEALPRDLELPPVDLADADFPQGWEFGETVPCERCGGATKYRDPAGRPRHPSGLCLTRS